MVNELIDQYGLQVVQKYMSYVRENAELAVRSLLKKVASNSGCILRARDYMDDGSAIELKVSIEPDQGSAVFDFT